MSEAAVSSPLLNASTRLQLTPSVERQIDCVRVNDTPDGTAGGEAPKKKL
jgi:hypothetical protein